MIGSLSRSAVARGFASKQKRSLLEWVQHEAKKVVGGCRLLYLDSKFMAKKKYNIMFHSDSVSLKERRLMTSTGTDLLKMIPFSFFIIIPGGEIFLPPALYVFPNMMPSTFVSKATIEAKQSANLAKRPLYANKIHAFLLETIKNTEEEEDFYNKLRNQPTQIELDELVNKNAYFRKNLSFGKLDSDQLQTICKFLGLEPWTFFNTFNKIGWGPISKLLNWLIPGMMRTEYNPRMFPFYQIKRNLLMLQLSQALEAIRREDRSFLSGELIMDVSGDLLRTLCLERGINPEYNTEAELRLLLEQWIQYSTIPGKQGLITNELLIFSHVFDYIEDTIYGDEVEEFVEAITQEDGIGGIVEESVARMIHAYDYRSLLDELENDDLENMTPEQKTTNLEQLYSMMDDNLEFEEAERIEMQILRLNAVPAIEEETLGPAPKFNKQLIEDLEINELTELTEEFKTSMLEQLYDMMDNNLDMDDLERIEFQILRLTAVPEENVESLTPEPRYNVKLLEELEKLDMKDLSEEYKTMSLEQLHNMMDDNLEFGDHERIEIQIMRLHSVPEPTEESLGAEPTKKNDE